MKKLLASIFVITFLIIVLLIISGFLKVNNNAQSPTVTVLSETGETSTSVATPTSTPILQPQLIRENPAKVWMQNDQWHR